MNPSLRLAFVVLAASAAACGSSSSDPRCNPTAGTGCSGSQVCEAVTGGTPACFDPVVILGAVTELGVTPTVDVKGARVVATDSGDAPVSAVALSAADGSYKVTVPAARAADGTPAAYEVSLRADASGYESFPGGTRVSLPVQVSSAVHQSGQWVVQGPLTGIALAKVTDSTRSAALHGTVAVPPDHSGVLVVAEHVVQLTDPSTGTLVPVVQGVSAIADRDGGYAIYNLVPDTYTVRAFSQGSNYASQSQALASGQDAQVNLTRTGAATATVTGGVNAVSGASGPTSIILAVRSTFDDPFGTGLPLGRATAVPGLRAALADVNVNGTIDGVPDGDYVVLAAYEDDGMVRQVSGQGGTQPVYLTVAGANASFTSPKVVSAVQLTAPIPGAGGAPPVLATGPQFAWTYGSGSSTRYDLRLYDATGQLVWSDPSPLFDATGAFRATGAFAGSCSTGCTYGYAGPALVPGMTYQLRVTAWSTNSSTWVPASRTEDLLGVFTWQP